MSPGIGPLRMFGRFTRIVALSAVVAHLWVSMVVLPWHHLVAHTLPGFAAGERPETTAATATSGCRCRHHSQRAAADVCADLNHKSAPSAPAKIPDPHDDCPICQVLAQPFQVIAVAAQAVVTDQVEFFLPLAVAQPMLGILRDPVSRGPPTV